MRIPTSATGNEGRRAEAGFTLVELLAALAVLGLAMGLVATGLSGRWNRPSVEVLASRTASRARAARDEAIRSGRETMLWIDLAQRSISTSGRGRELVIPPSIDLEVLASRAASSTGKPGVRFFPDGTSTGGTIRMGPVGRAHEVRINWFTGRVLVAPPG